MGTLFGTVAGRGCDMVLSLSLPVSLTAGLPWPVSPPFTV